MHPVLFQVGGIAIGTHDVFVLLGAAIAAGWFALECHRRFEVGVARR
jgi:hypothetical protein